jgi:mannose-6-phosphate isomerase-like protein (cupin superfamily)
MLSVGDRFESPDGQTWIEVLAAPDGEQRDIVVRRMQKPGKGKLVPHVHMDFTERFKVERGRAKLRLAGRKLELGPGEEVLIAPGENHTNAYNGFSDEELVMVHSFEPAPGFIRAFVETFCRLTRSGRTDRQGEVPLSAVFAVADATDSQSFAVGLPHALQRSVMAPIGSRVARMRGYELSIP